MSECAHDHIEPLRRGGEATEVASCVACGATFVDTATIRRRVSNFGGFQRPRSFYIDREDVLRLCGDYEAVPR